MTYGCMLVNYGEYVDLNVVTFTTADASSYMTNEIIFYSK